MSPTLANDKEYVTMLIQPSSWNVTIHLKISMTTTNTNSNQSDKLLEAMKNFAEQYAKRTETYFCSEPSVTAVVIEGLARHKEELGAPLCPCRHYEDKEAEVKNTYWNCPCVPMRERKECHCMLFITPDNEFAGQEQEIDLEFIKEVREGMSA
ncbi:ferredoxin thioredoxin reductase catalytic chain [Crocosphaera subtropica ATCC 51142]|uniref:ferredoxin:thioredoxin reductase n=2 Tax=Crocosphaera TaxID=263510 RepID=B1WYY2_CROS5|nr:ferredoxin thioredoxin reductase catalytic chain [Crocosphaera subtropica ATCC 51142]